MSVCAKTQKTGKWLSVRKYAKKIGVSPQVVYNWIAKNKKGFVWREKELIIKRKQVYWEEVRKK